MKDIHWIFVFASILITPFLPALLRAKCPKCKKRKMQSLLTLKIASAEDDSGFTYMTLHRCDACQSLFKQVKSGDIEEATSQEHSDLKAAALN